MIRWEEPAPRNEAERQLRDDLADPFTPNRELAHDERLDRQDRLAEKASVPFYMVHVEQPSERERREHFDEAKARNLLRPRTGNVEVQPRSIPVCTCNARDKRVHDGHRYTCPRHDRHPAAIGEAA